MGCVAVTIRGRRLTLAVGLALVAMAPSSAAAPAGPPSNVSARLTLDNDHFNFWQPPGWRPDFGYTHGTELAIRFPRAPRALARFTPAWLMGEEGRHGVPSLELRFRQNIYSPWTRPADRPYAGWLEGAVGLSRGNARSHRELLVHAGVTGPPSLAGSVQRTLHRRIDAIAPPNWDDQLPFEPGVGLEAGAAQRFAAGGGPAGWSAHLGGAGRLRLGTYAVDLRLGIPLVMGWSPRGPWPAATPRNRGASLYVRAHPHLDLIARDEFLDGTLFRDSPGPGSRALVGESEVAFGCGWNRLQLEWVVFRRSREFDGQPNPHTYASLSAAWNP
ncbi:MAG: lipid A deacylase LpxR family protein [Candidatus Eisenbacteria bacterium]